MIRRFLKYYKSHIPLFVFDMVSAVIVAVCNLFYPTIAKNIINGFSTGSITLDIVFANAILLFVIYIVKAIFQYVIGQCGKCAAACGSFKHIFVLVDTAVAVLLAAVFKAFAVYKRADITAKTAVDTLFLLNYRIEKSLVVRLHCYGVFGTYVLTGCTAAAVSFLFVNLFHKKLLEKKVCFL